MNAQNYGFIYNELVVDLTRNRLIKRTRRSLIDGTNTSALAIQQRKEGEMKLRKEIQFYLCIQAYHRIPLPFVMPRFYASPTIASPASPELHIQYFQDYEPLTERFPYAHADAACSVIREILDHIRPLHEHSPRIQITENEYRQALRVEVYDKIVERYYSVDWKKIYPEFERLTHVNGVKVRSFIEYATIIKDRVDALGSPATNSGRSLTYIHGDTHLGNILVPKPGVCISNDTPRYVFIDPRGYFASYDVFGEPHYDYAKLLFGISGYSRFDQMTIERCEVNEAVTDVTDLPEIANGISGLPEMNITIPFIDEYSSIYKSLDTPEWQSSVPELTAELTRLISLSIWLGNNSTFISPDKKLMSLMISRYMCERFLV